LGGRDGKVRTGLLAYPRRRIWNASGSTSSPDARPGLADQVRPRPIAVSAVRARRPASDRNQVRRPGADIAAIDLSDTVAGHPGAGAAGGDVGEVLDKQALSAYRRRLAEIDAHLDEARSWANTGRPAKLAAERDALLDQIRAATGLGGRPRVPGSAHERARIAVRKAIVNAIDRVAAADPSLGRLLSDTVTAHWARRGSFAAGTGWSELV
jgi:hypothetical protein